MKDLPFGYSASICNSEMLHKEAYIVNGKLSFGGKQTFPLLILPENPMMEYTTLKRIAELINDGLIVYGAKPTELLSLSNLKVNKGKFEKLVDAIWGKTSSAEVAYGKGKVITGISVEKVFKNWDIVPDFSSNVPNRDLQYFHKKIGDADVYFVFNQQNKTINRELLFRMKDAVPEIWNPESGLISKPIIYASEKNQIRIPVTFNSYETLLFVFRKGYSSNVINTVYLNGDQIFPNKSGLGVEIPIGIFDKKYSFRTNTGGKYTFTTIEGKTIELDLPTAKTAEIVEYNAHLEFFPVYDGNINPIKISKLKSLIEFDDLSVKYFSGKIKYTIIFDAPENFDSYDNFILNLGEMSATSEVYLNGEFLKYAWQSNEDILFSGLLKKDNKLEITVATACRNRFIGDLIQYGKIKNISTTLLMENVLNKDMPLTTSGIVGPLKISVL